MEYKGLGYALIPKLADYVLSYYNWQCVNAFFALLCFLSSVFGILLQPLNWRKRKGTEDSCNGSDEIKHIGIIIDECNNNDGNKPHVEEGYIYDDQHVVSSGSKGLKISLNGTGRDIAITNYGSNPRKDKQYSKSTNELMPSDQAISRNEELSHSRTPMIKNASFCLTGINLYPENCYSNLQATDKPNAEVLTLCHITTAFPEGSSFCAVSVRSRRSSQDEVNLSSSNEIQLNVAMKDTKILNSTATKFQTFAEYIKSSLPKDQYFVGLCISNILVFMGLGIPFAFGPDMMVQKQIMSKENGSNLITPIGLTSMIVMPLIGSLIDNGPRLDPIMVTALSLVSAGFSMILFTVCKTELVAIVIAIWFGISFSAILSLPPVILEKLVGEKEMKSAFSLLVLIRGISISIGGPLAGNIYDYTEKYDGAFYFAGGLFLIASIPLLTIYIKKKHR